MVCSLVSVYFDSPQLGTKYGIDPGICLIVIF